MSLPRRLRGAIIGCGYFGSIQLKSWRRTPGAEIVAACDLEADRARTACSRWYTSPEEMLRCETLDFVDIATPVASHLALVRLAISRRLHVICQKPIARSYDEAVEMVEQAEEAGVRLMVHENWRWQPWYRAAAELIAGGAIGRPISYWFRSRDRDGWGAEPYPKQAYFRGLERFLIDEALVHYIDTARFLFGDVCAVYAQARTINPVIKAEDQAILIVTHDSGLLGTIDGHRFLDPEPTGPAMGEAGFEGEAGALFISATGDVYSGGERIYENRVREGYRGDSVRATQQHFIECLVSGRAFETEGREYLKTFAVVEAAYRSLARCRVITLANEHSFAVRQK